MRVLFDSNVWLSVLTSRGICRKVWRRARKTCDIHGSEFICSEVREHLEETFGFSPRNADKLTAFARSRMKPVVEATLSAEVCRDPDDIPVLAAAVGTNCAYLVTGDKDLLALKEFSGVKIVTVREFEKSLVSRETTL